jgi:hypothetical protein
MFKRGVTMISYEPLFQTMKKKKISSYELDKRGFPRIMLLNMGRELPQIHLTTFVPSFSAAYQRLYNMLRMMLNLCQKKIKYVQ